jgi:hypothetical protein
VRSSASPLILAETLEAPAEPLAWLVSPEAHVSPAQACGTAARALLDLPERSPPSPEWLAPHQVRAFTRIMAILRRFGGAVLADAVGSGKSYVSLAAAQALPAPLVLVVPAVLVAQWRALLDRLAVDARVLTHERLSRDRLMSDATRLPGSFVIVDEAHHYRNPGTRRYQSLARMVVGCRVLLVSATPVHNRSADLLNLLRLFLRDDALVGFGLPSLAVAAREADTGSAVHSAMSRLVVARSRRRVMSGWSGMRFPNRTDGPVIRAATAEARILTALTEGIQALRPPGAAPLHRLTLLRRLASSLAALRQSLRRYEAFRTVAAEAGRANRRLTLGEFRRSFPMEDDADLQLAFLPLLLDQGSAGSHDPGDLALVRRLLEITRSGEDPKADALARRLAGGERKTIVFIGAAATVQYLRRTLPRGLRIGAVTGTAGWLGPNRVSRFDVLAAFAPQALGVAPPPARAAVHVLLATDLVGEGLNLQDAARVIHYDLPWSPARLAQRVGRIDRVASQHREIETVTFVPVEPLATALELEARLAAKVTYQLRSGAAQVETPLGGRDADAPLDWCDRLQSIALVAPAEALPGVSTAVSADRDALVLIVKMGDDVEAVVVEAGTARADPARATALLEEALAAPHRPQESRVRSEELGAAAGVVRSRIADISAARWRAADRDRPGRRLIPMVLAAARRAAKGGRGNRLARLDSLVARLTGGLTAGEGFLLDNLIGSHRPLDVGDLLAWHDRLPPIDRIADAPLPRLVAVVRLVREP